MSKYQQVYDYLEVYNDEDWALASEHAWARLESIANEHQRGEIDWERAKELADETTRDVRRAVCDAEFGEHTHDDAECQRMLGEMRDDHLQWEYDMYSREAEEESLGRPLFPNEY